MIEIKKHQQWIKQVYRWIGYGVARVAGKTPITANQVTLSRLVFMAAAACCIQLGPGPWFWLAAFFIFLFSMLDAADGMVAKLKKTSLLGAWLDPQIDRIGFLILFSAVAGKLAVTVDNAPLWVWICMASYILFMFRGQLEADIYYKGKFLAIKEALNPKGKAAEDGPAENKAPARSFWRVVKGWIAAVKLQTAPHTHNVALYIMIALVCNRLAAGIVFIGSYAGLWLLWENLKVLRVTFKHDRQAAQNSRSDAA